MTFCKEGLMIKNIMIIERVWENHKLSKRIATITNNNSNQDISMIIMLIIKHQSNTMIIPIKYGMMIFQRNKIF